MVRKKMQESLVLKTFRPVSLLLLDIQMPKKSGIQVITEMKRFFKNVNNMADDGVQVLEPKIVILTSYLTPGLREHIKNLGCNNFYDKPVSLHHLKEILVDMETF